MLLGLTAPHRGEQAPIVFDCGVQVWMFVPGTLGEQEKYLEMSSHERLGLGQVVGGPEQLRQVVEVDGDLGMLGAEALLVDGQCPAHEWLGLGQAVGVLEQ